MATTLTRRPAVSVVVTVLNEAATIARLLQALAAQTTLPDEVVIVDGGSTDQTLAVLEQWRQHHRALQLIVISQPGNRSIGRNIGIKTAAHDWIAITDAGCVPHHDWLEKLVARATIATADSADSSAAAKAVVVAGYYDAITRTAFEEAVVPYVLVMPDRLNPDQFLPATRSLLLQRRAWQLVGGFDERLSDNEDYAFAHALSRHKDILLIFTAAAKVSWLPRSNWRSFAWMIYRFARGDMQAGLVRPKVLAIFARYLVGLMLVLALPNWPARFSLFAVALLLYAGWAILKNRRYVPHGWYWLPILQVVSDVMVMAGSLSGCRARWFANSR